MTEPNSANPREAESTDQAPYPFSYGHGRMPAFMKLAWVVALAGMTWYVVKFLLVSVGAELGQ